MLEMRRRRYINHVKRDFSKAATTAATATRTSENNSFKGAIHLNAIFPPLDTALMEISHSRFKQSKNPIIIP